MACNAIASLLAREAAVSFPACKMEMASFEEHNAGIKDHIQDLYRYLFLPVQGIRDEAFQMVFELLQERR